MTRTTDEELLAAVRAEQPHAFQDLRDRHWPTAVAVARLHTPSRPDAEQLAGTAVDQVVADLPAGDGPEAFLRARLVGVVGRAGAEPPRSAEAVSRVYLGLPPAWQAVLWHTEVEALPLDRTAAVLGLSPAATTALHLEARAGLRAAYRRLRLDHPRTSACEECAGELGAFVDGALPGPRRREVEAHLDGCPRCTADLLYLQDTEAGLRGWVLPVLAGVPLWGAAVDELGEIVRTAGRAGAERPAAAPGADHAGGSLAAVGTARRGRKVLLGAGTLAAAAALAGLAVTGTGGPGDRTTRAADSGGAGVGAPSGSSSTSAAEDRDGRALASGPGTSGAGVPSLPVVDPSPGPLTEAAATARSAARGSIATAGGGAADTGAAAPGDDGARTATSRTATSRSTGGGSGAAAERTGTDAPAGERAPDGRSTPSGRSSPDGRSTPDGRGDPGGAATGGGSGGTPAPQDGPAPAPRDPAGPPAQDRPGDRPAEQPSTPPAEQPDPAAAEPPSAPPTTPPDSPPVEQPDSPPVEQPDPAPAEPPSAPPASPSTPPAGTPSMPPAAEPGPQAPDAPATVPATDPAPGGGAPSGDPAPSA
ncbi:zf-HC2 domain-containing protein [Kocuria turfanensis]|uniref:zf-HC2 domain-containing protein n=1 Tax=Kocuria turfanensis TaxID=388357 RepID=UPI004036C8A4